MKRFPAIALLLLLPAAVAAQVQPGMQPRAPVQIAPLAPGAAPAYPSSQPPRSGRLSTAPAQPSGTGSVAPGSLGANLEQESRILSGRSAGGVAQPNDGRLVIDANLCRSYSHIHVPAPDVQARSGVDAYGRPVPPAEAGGPAPLPHTSTDITVPNNQRERREYYAAETYAGTVTLDPSGRAMLNDQPLDSEAQQIAQLCRSQGFN